MSILVRLIFHCDLLRIPKSEPTSNSSDYWLVAANAKTRLMLRAFLVVESHLALNTLSKQDSLTAGRSIWHEYPSLGHTEQPDIFQPSHFFCHGCLCVGPEETSRMTSGKPLEPV